MERHAVIFKWIFRYLKRWHLNWELSDDKHTHTHTQKPQFIMDGNPEKCYSSEKTQNRSPKAEMIFRTIPKFHSIFLPFNTEYIFFSVFIYYYYSSPKSCLGDGKWTITIQTQEQTQNWLHDKCSLITVLTDWAQIWPSAIIFGTKEKQVRKLCPCHYFRKSS